MPEARGETIPIAADSGSGVTTDYSQHGTSGKHASGGKHEQEREGELDW